MYNQHQHSTSTSIRTVPIGKCRANSFLPALTDFPSLTVTCCIHLVSSNSCAMFVMEPRRMCGKDARSPAYLVYAGGIGVL